MSQPSGEEVPNVLPLRARRRPTERSRATSQQVSQVRHHLSVLQGYTDLMQGLSARQQAYMLRAVAEKTRALSEILAPFLVQEPESRPPIGTYRRARERSRQVMADYRTLLDHLHQIVEAPPRSRQ